MGSVLEDRPSVLSLNREDQQRFEAMPWLLQVSSLASTILARGQMEPMQERLPAETDEGISGRSQEAKCKSRTKA